jgi:hypothetical protein
MTDQKLEQEFEDIRDELHQLQTAVSQLDSKSNSLFNVISGNDPVIGKQLSFAERLLKVEKGYNFIRILLIGIGVGILIGGLIFGVLTLKQFTDAVKTVTK